MGVIRRVIRHVAVSVILVMNTSGCGLIWRSTSTVLEPLPVKFSIQSSSVGVGIPLVIEKKKSGGYRSPIELKIDIELDSVVGIPAQVKPTGVVGGVRLRW